MNKKSITSKCALSKDQAIAYLEALAASLKKNQICVEAGDEYVVLEAAENMELEVNAAQKKGKEKIMLELSWTQPMVLENEEQLKISSKVPAPKLEQKKEEKPVAPPKPEAKTEIKLEPAKS